MHPLTVVAAVFSACVVAWSVWVNGGVLAEKRASDRQAQVERADYRACAAELARVRSLRGGRR